MQPGERPRWRYRLWLLHWWVCALLWLAVLVGVYADMAIVILRLIGAIG